MEEDLVIINERVKKEKIFNFYKKNKYIIFSIIFVLLFSIAAFFLYEEKSKNEQIDVANDFIIANIKLENKDKVGAKEILEKIIFKNDNIYSSLSLFLLIDQNLINSEEKILELFDYVIGNNNLDFEQKNLLIYKKGVAVSEFGDETLMLSILNPLINSDSVWKGQSLILLGDYFFYKNNYLKAKEFYKSVLLERNLSNKMLNETKKKLNFITNE